MYMRDFLPDYTLLYTSHEAEHELKGFKFTGPGWYVTKTDTLLVVPDGDVEYTGSPALDTRRDPWKNAWKPGQKFWFFVWNGRNPGGVFDAVVHAPTRVDER